MYIFVLYSKINLYRILMEDAKYLNSQSNNKIESMFVFLKTYKTFCFFLN